ncbi:MAG: 3'-5' exonuclease [Verrucomicrobia bacterium]|nr:3'-5' exonuclease [Verrucomicrobiota bacterium]
MYLIFDTETTGLPKKYDAPITDLDNWPRVIQLAWAAYDQNRNCIAQRVDLIQPDGWEVPTETFWIENGFSQAQSLAQGIPIRQALTAFLEQIEHSSQLIAHNLSYDHPVLGAECLRAGLKSQNKPARCCTKEIATDYCAIPGNYGFKWPKLSELHQKLFQTDFDGAHDAMIDVQACARCYFELLDRGIIKT